MDIIFTLVTVINNTVRWWHIYCNEDSCWYLIFLVINPIVPVKACCRLFIKYAIPLLCMIHSVIVWCLLMWSYIIGWQWNTFIHQICLWTKWTVDQCNQSAVFTKVLISFAILFLSQWFCQTIGSRRIWVQVSLKMIFKTLFIKWKEPQGRKF